ncbi:MAG: hypothetical protein LBS29_04475 [Endomicrobium sp.]|jgi:hypothetical protein|nr:hypothetical protein [Endomicrobium sp.]
MKNIMVKLTFTEQALGLSPSSPDVYTKYIASKYPDTSILKEEIDAISVDETVKSMTIFPKLEDGTPFIWDYQIKGYFKDTCGMLSRLKDNDETTESSKLKAYKKEIDGLIFVSPRKIPITISGHLSTMERPLRISGIQERSVLYVSETIPAGSTVQFEIMLLKSSLKRPVLEWLDYGRLRGFSQWRNAGWGRFEYKATF